MSDIKIIFYMDDKGYAPVFEWLHTLPKKVKAKGFARIYRLHEKGHKLHRPEADYLGKGIFELRWSWQRVNYRILYFFHGLQAVVLTHALTKRDTIPERDINLAIHRKQAYSQYPDKHTFVKEF